MPQEAIVGVEAETWAGRTKYDYDPARLRWRDPDDIHAEHAELWRDYMRLRGQDEI